MIPSSIAAELRFRTAVVGGGIVGLAIGARLAQYHHPSTTTSDNVVVLEAHRHFLSETSSRNSGVVHAGIYYPPSSLKTALCMAGNKNIWQLAKRFPKLSARQCGKWIGACDVDEEAVLEALLNNMKDRGITDARYLSSSEISDAEPNLRMSKVVLSPSTGIVDVHSLGEVFLDSIRNPDHKSWASESATVTSVQIDYDRLKYGNAPCIITVSSSPGYGGGGGSVVDASAYTIEADTIVFSTGLHSNKLGQEIPINITSSDNDSVAFNNMKEELADKRTYFCKGRYVGYRSGKKPLVNRLIYPCPLPNLKGLGVHSVIDMAGGLKFGPDAHYITPDNDDDLHGVGARDSEEESSHLCDQFHSAILRYLPCIERDRLYVDFTGIRPKLARDGEGFRDFDISTYRLGGGNGGEEEKRTTTTVNNPPPTFVVLKGIESPGLTASTAIADMVAEGIWGPETTLSAPSSIWGQ